jgi:predicted GH43/DUF377 family glycosyl hydrolase
MIPKTSIYFIAVVVAACGTSTVEQTEAPVAATESIEAEEPEAPGAVEEAPASLFTFTGEDPGAPVIARGPADAYDGKYMNPGAVIFHEGRFHMLRNNFTRWPGVVSVDYLVSEDGVDWEFGADEPVVFTSDQVPYISGTSGADISSVYIEADGTWVAYFHTVHTSQPAQIGRATAPGPAGPWAVDPEPVLVGGDGGAWDWRGVYWPNVVQTEDGLFMFYGGKISSSISAIGLASSADGIHWAKYDDPSTTEAPHAESDPVLAASGEWEPNSVDRPRVQVTPDGWVMIFQGTRVTDRGLAFSQDGIAWQQYAENPFLTTLDFPVSGSTWDTSLLYLDNTYYYFMEIGTLAGTDIYLAMHEGPLVP